MRHRIAIILSATAALTITACTPAGPPAADNMAGNVASDELLDTSPDSLAAPDDANAIGNADAPIER